MGLPPLNFKPFRMWAYRHSVLNLLECGLTPTLFQTFLEYRIVLLNFKPFRMLGLPQSISNLLECVFAPLIFKPFRMLGCPTQFQTFQNTGLPYFVSDPRECGVAPFLQYKCCKATFTTKWKNYKGSVGLICNFECINPPTYVVKFRSIGKYLSNFFVNSFNFCYTLRIKVS